MPAPSMRPNGPSPLSRSTRRRASVVRRARRSSRVSAASASSMCKPPDVSCCAGERLRRRLRRRGVKRPSCGAEQDRLPFPAALQALTSPPYPLSLKGEGEQEVEYSTSRQVFE